MTVPFRLFATLAAALTLALAGCAVTPPVQTSSSSESVTVGLSYIPNIQFAPLYVADAEGLFTERGVTVSLRHHGSNEGLFTALGSGDEHFVVAGAGELMQARSQGMDLVAIAQYYRQYPVVLIVPETSPIQSPADLVGRSLGVPGRYGESWFGAQVMMQGAGLTESDVAITEIGYTPVAALSSGKVEALIGFANNDQVQFGVAGIPTRTIPLTTGPVPMVSTVLVTTQGFLDQHPDTARAVADAVVAGIDRTVKEPATAVTIAEDYIPNLAQSGGASSAAATLEATIPLWKLADGTVSGKLDPEAWQAMSAFMHTQGITATVVDPATAMSNEFVSA